MRKEPRIPLLVFLLASTTVVQIACTVTSPCPPGWTYSPTNSRCFLFSKERKTSAEARKACQATNVKGSYSGKADLGRLDNELDRKALMKVLLQTYNHKPQWVLENNVMKLVTLEYAFGQSVTVKLKFSEPDGSHHVFFCDLKVCGRRPLFPHRTGYRIISGRTTLPGEVPWQVLLKDYRLMGDSYWWYIGCGGSIIDARWIITSGYCAYAKSLYSVITGVTNLTHATVQNLGRNPHVQEHLVIKTITFGNPYHRQHDIALLKLATPIRFDDYSQPVCLPLGVENFERRVCTASGWGTTNKHRYRFSKVLMAVNLPVISERYCRKLAHKLGLGLHVTIRISNFVCTFDPMGGRSTCSGDNGGPLACLMDNGEYLLAGLSKTFFRCGHKKSPSLFTKVHHYISWIRNVTGLNF